MDLLLGRDDDVENLSFHAKRLDALLQVALDGILVAGVRVHRVPARILLLRHSLITDFLAHRRRDVRHPDIFRQIHLPAVHVLCVVHRD